MPSGSSTPNCPRQTRSGSSSAGVTLNDIKVLIENLRVDVLSALKNEVDSLKSTIATLQASIDELREENEALKNKYKYLNNQYNNLNNQLLELGPPDFNKIAQEVENRAHKKFNLVISGVPEPVTGSSEARAVSDSSTCTEILETLGIGPDDVCEVSRLGRPSAGRDRLLRVRCRQMSARNEALRRARDLRKHTKFRGVFINPDRTPMQQLSHKELISELNHRKRNNEDVVIFRNKVIPRREIKTF